MKQTKLQRAESDFQEHAFQIQSGKDVSHVKSARKGFGFALLALGVVAALIALLIYWGFYPYDVLDIKKEPIPVKKVQTKEGQPEILLLELDYCKLSDSTGKVERFMVSDLIEVRLPTYEDKLGKSCDNVEAPTIIPPTAPTGRYHIRYEVTYRVNPLKTIFETFNTKEFDHVRSVTDGTQTGQ